MWCIGMYTEWFAFKVSFTVQLKETIVLLEYTVVLTTAVLIDM